MHRHKNFCSQTQPRKREKRLPRREFNVQNRIRKVEFPQKFQHRTFCLNFIQMPLELSFQGCRRLKIAGGFEKFIFNSEIFAKIYELLIRFFRKNKPNFCFIFNPRSDTEKIDLCATPFQVIPNVKNLLRLLFAQY